MKDLNDFYKRLYIRLESSYAYRFFLITVPVKSFLRIMKKQGLTRVISAGTSFIVCFFVHLDKFFKWRKEESLALPNVVLIVSTKCTLKCKDCTEFMPHYRKEISGKLPYDIDAQSLLQYLDKLLHAVDQIGVLSIMGGEPFIYNDLDLILDYLDKHIHAKKIRKITFTTNGTVMPDKKLQPFLKKKNTGVIISDYGTLSKQKTNLIKYFKENDIIYSVHEKANTWWDMGGVEPRGTSVKDFKEQVKRCHLASCHAILNGEFFICQRAAMAADLGYLNYEEDKVDLCAQGPNDTRRALIHYLNVKNYYQSCNHCDIGTDRMGSIDAAIQVADGQEVRQ